MGTEIYSFEFTSSIFESSFEVISLHKTKRGAYTAMKEFLNERYTEWRDDGILYGKQRFKFGTYQNWRINTIKVWD